MGESQLGEEGGGKDIGKWKPVKMCSVNGWNGRCKLQLSLILILKHINLPKQWLYCMKLVGIRYIFALSSVLGH